MFPPLKFESSVISYGNQTSSSLSHSSSEFESSVISYGNQTLRHDPAPGVWFESSVISYGNQTESVRSAVSAAV